MSTQELKNKLAKLEDRIKILKAEAHSIKVTLAIREEIDK